MNWGGERSNYDRGTFILVKEKKGACERCEKLWEISLGGER